MGKHHNAISKIYEKEGVKISENSICVKITETGESWLFWYLLPLYQHHSFQQLLWTKIQYQFLSF